MIKYEVIINWSEEDDCYIAEAPELPGCLADGSTQQEALANLGVIMDEWLETAHEVGKPIPEPKRRLVPA